MEYRLIDADEHYYEPDDCFSRHIEARFKDETISVRRGDDGLGRVFLRGRRVFMSVMPGDYASAPGALQGLFVGEVADGFTHREVINAKDHPAFTDRSARLALMDAQGVEAAIMLPTLGVSVEYDMRDDVDLTYASLRALNRWLEEDWGYGGDGGGGGDPVGLPRAERRLQPCLRHPVVGDPRHPLAPAVPAARGPVQPRAPGRRYAHRAAPA